VEKARVSLGQADFTCPYCHRPLRFDPTTNRVVPPQGGEPLRYHYGAAVRRAAFEKTSVFGLMRDKQMLHAGKPAFLDYLFKDRDTPLSAAEGDTIHADEENGT
jgi:hypothetical protein